MLEKKREPGNVIDVLTELSASPLRLILLRSVIFLKQKGVSELSRNSPQHCKVEQKGRETFNTQAVCLKTRKSF